MPFLLLETISNKKGFSSLEVNQMWLSSRRMNAITDEPASGLVTSNERFDKFDVLF
jgi:hypothetical protein